MDTVLAFEPLSEAHLDIVSALWADPAVIRYTSVDAPLTRDEAAVRLAGLLRAGEAAGTVLFAVVYGGEICGIVGCPPVNAGKGEYGLFYQIRGSDWGKGVGFGCAKWMVSYMAEKYGPVTLFADAAEENAASVKILEKLGFRRVAGKDDRDGAGVLHFKWKSADAAAYKA